MTTKLTYEKFCDLLYSRSTGKIWFKSPELGIVTSLHYDDAGHCQTVTVAGIISISFDKCTEGELQEGILNLYRKDVFVGCLDIRDLEVWE